MKKALYRTSTKSRLFRQINKRQKLSIRQLAKRLNLSRREVKTALAELFKEYPYLNYFQSIDGKPFEDFQVIEWNGEREQ